MCQLGNISEHCLCDLFVGALGSATGVSHHRFSRSDHKSLSPIIQATCIYRLPSCPYNTSKSNPLCVSRSSARRGCPEVDHPECRWPTYPRNRTHMERETNRRTHARATRDNLREFRSTSSAFPSLGVCAYFVCIERYPDSFRTIFGRSRTFHVPSSGYT